MPATYCEIANDILINCTNPPLRGAKDRVIIVPRRSVSAIALNSTNHLIVEGITIETGERAYEYIGDGTLLSPANSMVRDEFGIRYPHRLPFKVHGATPAIKKELEYLSKEREGVIVILEQNYQGDSGNSKYLVLGKDAGLYVTVLADEEGRNIYSIELTSMDGYEEPHMPANFFITSAATTKLAVEALLVAASA
jgi:hypothetical protein